MKKLLLVAALLAAGPAVQAAADQETQPGTTTAQQNYDQQVRDAEAARRQYEAAQAQYQRDLARNQADVERARAAQADYDRRMARRQARASRRSGNSQAASATTQSGDAQLQASAGGASTGASEQCQEQQQRGRRRGRAIGGLAGGVAGGLLGRGGTLQRLATVALAAPVGALIGDAIARRLDCHEQRQAAAATEQVVERGVGSTQTWTSETRPGVTGSSTVTAVAAPADGNPCVTVTDVIIVDGEETRAPKRMCRRPPTNRYVRV